MYLYGGEKQPLIVGETSISADDSRSFVPECTSGPSLVTLPGTESTQEEDMEFESNVSEDTHSYDGELLADYYSCNGDMNCMHDRLL